jgi:hypothetical protein
MAFGRGYGQGAGRRFGRGRGFCRSFFTEPEPLSKDAQKQLLEAGLKRIEAEKTEIEKRLTSLE